MQTYKDLISLVNCAEFVRDKVTILILMGSPSTNAACVVLPNGSRFMANTMPLVADSSNKAIIVPLNFAQNTRFATSRTAARWEKE
jgi:hypothetical protein